MRHGLLRLHLVSFRASSRVLTVPLLAWLLLAQIPLDHNVHLAQGRAPQNTVFEDVEEEYKIDEHGNGSWQPVERQAAPKVLLKVEPGPKPKRKKAVKKAAPHVEEL